MSSLSSMSEGEARTLISKVSQYVEEYMSNFDASHDWHHIRRVVGLAQKIASEETAKGTRYDTTIIILAALLHDVGDRKYLKEGQDPKTLVRDVLLNYGLDTAIANVVQEICTNVSYSSEIKNPQKVREIIERHPELAVVQDADRLDAIGAVGIGRCFTYGGALHGKDPASSKGRSMGHTMEHFDEKLVRLEGMMKTKTGKEMARVRTERLRQFMSWWEDEVEVEDCSLQNIH